MRIVRRVLRSTAIACLLGCVALPAISAPADKNALLRQADQYADQGKLKQARQAYEQAIEAGADLEHDYTRARALGLAYMNGAPPQFAQAAKWLEIAWKLRPQDENTRLLLAQSLAWDRRFAPALEHYRALASARPESREYTVGLANTLVWSGATDEALSLLRSFVEKFPSDNQVRLEYARLLGYSRKYSEAMTQYQAVLQADPGNIAAEVGVAKVNSWQSQYELALEQFNKILKRKSDYDALVGKAYTLRWMRRSNEAREAFQSAVQMNPADKQVAAALKSLGPPPRKQETAKAKPEAPPIAPIHSGGPESDVAKLPSAETVLEASPPSVQIQSDTITKLQQEANDAAAGGNFADAIRGYQEILHIDATRDTDRLQLARVLSWSGNYNDSVLQYDELLRAQPADLTARMEKARVLSWGRRFAESETEYERVIKEAESQPPGQAAVSIDDARLEYARVLGWDGRYNESLAQLAILLPDNRKPEAKDRTILSEKAKILAWQRRYDESLASYDQLLALGSDPETRLARAQTLYWAGRYNEAEAQLRAVLQEQPKNPVANFVMAGVQRGLGHNARALSLLRNAPQDEDTSRLRSSIREDLRPVLRLRFGFEDDREVAPSGLATGIKALRYTAGIEFNIHPDVRMEVLNTVTRGLTSNPVLRQFGDESLANESLARLTFRPTEWLRLTLGAGDGITGAGELGATEAGRRHHFLYDIHPVISHGDFRLDVSAVRRIAEYTPLAVHNNVVVYRESADASYTWRKRLRIGAEAWQGHYSLEAPDARKFDTDALGGAAYVTPIFHQSDRLMVEAGLRYEMFGFNDSAALISDPVIGLGSAGFFTPRVYQRYAGTGHITWDPGPKVHLDFHGTFGPQRIFGFASLNPPPAEFGNTGSVGAEIGFSLSWISPFVAYDFFSTATPATTTLISPGLGTGAYRSHSFVIGISHRF